MKKDFLSLFLNFIVRLSMCVSIGVFLLIVFYILINGLQHLNLRLFELHYNSENVSMFSAIINTFTLIILCLLICTTVAIFGAIFLEEYANSNSFFVRLIVVATETLAGIPSIVYGLFGYLAFVLYLNLGLSLISGALTLSIMILPLILRNTQEAIKAVDESYKEASFGLGASKLRTIFCVVLPCSLSGILAGIILSIGRIIGESAALLYTFGTVAQTAFLTDSGRTLSVHMYALLSEGQFINQAYATAVILLIMVICINFCSNYVINHFNPFKKG
ncbi:MULTISPECIES: phosphate ABC transporter permease PstA [unclassified Campylobacter]|uniref:phosphate ABC transporter permease PstA n=1 Tax=unclassified Campylobacter TaxID=2593542 RepID=UPI001237C885|nr:MULTISPECIES: phosphate ABC transporter permease PstA [unclassified Campylobacter]KAA6225103.1 phosphate ABC transporter permease PstA [Campylobacter sp. LR196d]KAA6226117.1 phosphate ABC transporter permease PstA [Campylobacter sp. LR185c]KAA6228064.1 phosphate ABC transporter permease PstA [Campylobacter sp. LR286c]KAA6231317.1 phosphate ABC transporter permease PstA [Campylobacter sp. LR264d]KAA6231529.1 phosphate ABC transporter permease PstA [Campylobacter sp. LR291e]